MTAADFEKLMDVAIAKAPKAREAGIRRVAIGDVELELAPAEQEAPTFAGDEKDHSETDALNDPTTFGRTKRVPGRQPPSPEDDE